MSNAATHFMAASVTGMSFVVAEHVTDSESKSNPVMALAFSILGGKLPDIIEPATSPHHRKFFHSVAVMLAVGWGVKQAYEWTPETSWEKFARLALIFGGVGYISHLALDATTPMGLPLLK